jgi:cell shape-determining protein MreC
MTAQEHINKTGKLRWLYDFMENELRKAGNDSKTAEELMREFADSLFNAGRLRELKETNERLDETLNLIKTKR